MATKKDNVPDEVTPKKGTTTSTGRVDPSNWHKEENDADTELQNDADKGKSTVPGTPAESRVSSPEGKIVPKRVTDTNKKKNTNGGVVIQAISGRTITVAGGGFDDNEKIAIAGRADVTLNDQKVTLAALDNGDTVQLGNLKPDRKGVPAYHTIKATREETK